jgi:hypothetical protein
MPILRVTRQSGNEKTKEFHGNSSAISGELGYKNQVSPAPETINKGFITGCFSCGKIVERFINYKYKRLCSSLCWNNWMRNGGALEVKEKLEEIRENCGIRKTSDYRLRNDEDWLLEIKGYHSKLEAPNAHHSSVYTCNCSYARNLRASELGLTFEEGLIFERIN